ncbi:MAG: hypothetical protein J6K90_05245 [Tidjanibacter sp.]|nr:hypothetical protein [Tidjanibacter sp.]
MDKSTFSILFIMQKGKPNAEGNAPIFARITINHQMTHLATRYLTQIDDSHWLLDTMVCNYVGIGRFVLGLSGDIKILTPEFEEYIIKRAEEIYNRYLISTIVDHDTRRA